jgi:SPP1 gp7 family putative phage head morphogenesis protein
MAAATPNISQIVADAIVTHHVNLLRVAAELRGPVFDQLIALERGIVSEIQALPEDAGAVKVARLRALLAQTKTIIDEAYATIAANQGKQLGQLAGIEESKTAKAYNAAIGVDVISVGLTKEQLQRLAGDTLIKGRFQSQWWDQQAYDLKKQFEAAMRMGIYQGEGVAALVRRVSPILNLKKSQAEAIVRTSVMATANQTKLDSFENNLDVISAVQWVSTLDSRTTEICVALDGKQWSLPEYEPIDHTVPFPGPIAHWNCRSTQIAVTKSWKELSGPKAVNPPDLPPADIETIFRQNLEAKGFDAAAIDAIVAKKKFQLNGEPAPRQSMDQFLKRQTAQFQNDLLGVQKAQLWREGKITLTDLIDQTHRPLSIDELRALVAKNETLPEPKYKEGQNGLGLLERKLLEESIVFGSNTDGVMSHFLDTTNGMRLSIRGTSPTVADLEKLKQFASVTYLRNATAAGEVFTPQEIRLFADIPNFNGARIVTPDGKVVSVSLRASRESFTAADAREINLAIANAGAGKTDLAAMKEAANLTGSLKVDVAPVNSVVPSARAYVSKLPDVANPQAFFDPDFVAAKKTAEADASKKAVIDAEAKQLEAERLAEAARVAAQQAADAAAARRTAILEESATIRGEFTAAGERVLALKTERETAQAGLKAFSDAFNKRWNMAYLGGQIPSAVEDAALKQMQAELVALRGTLTKINADYLFENASTIAKMRGRLELEADVRSTIRAQFREGGERVAGIAREGVSILNKLASNGLLSDVAEFAHTPPRVTRAYCELNGLTRLHSTASTARTALHELGHWIEATQPNVAAKCREFLSARTAGEAAKKLNRLQPGFGYKNIEVAKPDKFIDPYMGKIYLRKNGETYATEILSMGLEHMWFNPAEFAARDPEYFDFIYSLIRK